MRFLLWDKAKLIWAGAALAVFLLLCLAAGAFLFFAAGQPALAPVYRAPAGQDLVGLMINVDWGQEILPEMLEVLKQENITATFFISGRFARQESRIVRDIAAAGHQIANHGYSHPHVDKLTLEENQEEIRQTKEALAQAGVTETLYYAPPYGEKKAHVVQAAENLGYTAVFWSLDTLDWQEPAVETLVERIVPQAGDGDLILAHPKTCTVQALPLLAAGIREKGLAFADLTTLFGRRKS
jgi:peptidoglycan/xylan/chitin deacetylase (PgdA/CDA1 family)